MTDFDQQFIDLIRETRLKLVQQDDPEQIVAEARRLQALINKETAWMVGAAIERAGDIKLITFMADMHQQGAYFGTLGGALGAQYQGVLVEAYLHVNPRPYEYKVERIHTQHHNDSRMLTVDTLAGRGLLYHEQTPCIYLTDV